MIRPIHPFPARMAPEIAIAQLESLPKGSVVVDPMMGSGTVLRHAVEFGHRAIGFDLDPLAVLMSRVWSTPIATIDVNRAFDCLHDALPRLDADEVSLPWMDEDEETDAFAKFWFGERQRRDLRRLAFGIAELEAQGGEEVKTAADVLRVALSRIIVTKSSGASLAWDVSHSRPHKKMEKSDFDVISGFKHSVQQLMLRLEGTPVRAKVRASVGDARILVGLRRNTADMVLTSPPYLNAIDYMRGHKLSLVWLGHSIKDLRSIRSTCVGAERAASGELSEVARSVQVSMVDSAQLENRLLAMIERYSMDLVKSLSQCAKALKPGGKAIYVVGNSCLKETFIHNSSGVTTAATAAGLTFVSEAIRNLPTNSRYLPMPKRTDSALGKRMRTESVLTFQRAA